MRPRVIIWVVCRWMGRKLHISYPSDWVGRLPVYATSVFGVCMCHMAAKEYSIILELLWYIVYKYMLTYMCIYKRVRANKGWHQTRFENLWDHRNKLWADQLQVACVKVSTTRRHVRLEIPQISNRTLT